MYWKSGRGLFYGTKEIIQNTSRTVTSQGASAWALERLPKRLRSGVPLQVTVTDLFMLEEDQVARMRETIKKNWRQRLKGSRSCRTHYTGAACVWIGFIWLMTRTGVGLLWMRQWQAGHLAGRMTNSFRSLACRWLHSASARAASKR